MLSIFSTKKYTRLGLVALFKSAHSYRTLKMCYLKDLHLGDIQGQVPWAKCSKILYVLFSLDNLE